MRGTSIAGRIFDVCNVLIMIVLCITTIYPFLYLLSLSLSPNDASFVQIRIIPEKFSLVNFQEVLRYDYVIKGFINSVERTILGTALTLIVTISAAYVLSKRYFPHVKLWTVLIVFTMFFQGGMIPSYLLVRGLGLMNSIWALTLPILISAFQLIVARNFMLSIPEEMEEAAKIDGANDLYVLWKIVIPVSMPIIATLGLWNAVNHWNQWFDSLIYMTDRNNDVMQVVMRRIVLQGQLDLMSDLAPHEVTQTSPETIKAATVMVTTIPIILVYPFLQKYFVKGMLLGSVKG